MKSISCKSVDVFTAVPHKGNPAGVVTTSRGLSVAEMQTVAMKMNFSETVFVLPPKKHSADVRLRWFTPTNEVPLCGHATVAAFHALAEENLFGMKEDGTFSFRVETASGILPVEVRKENRKARVKFGLPLPLFKARHDMIQYDFAHTLRIENGAFGPYHFPTVISGGNIFFPVRRLSTLFEMQPQFDRLGTMLKQRRLMGACVFSVETIDRQSTFHSRYFAPNDGINEDPVTGSTNGPLGVYMVQYGVVPAKDDTVEMVGEQGDVIGKNGRVSVEVKISRKHPSAVSIAGSAITFDEKTIEV